MFCSGCGLALAPGQAVCQRCGRPVAPTVATMPDIQFQVENYRSKVRALSVVWFIYAGFSLLFGLIGVLFARAAMAGQLGPWASEHMNAPFLHGPMMPFFGPGLLHLIWIFMLMRGALALVAAWGLMEHAPWARWVAIIVACLSLLKFPFGTALGIWTLVVLAGYRNATLFEQL